MTISTASTVRQTPPQMIMEVIKRSSWGAPLLFRAYNHVLRRFGDEYEARSYFGARFRCNLDDMISRTIFYFGFWEPNNSSLISSILRPGDVFVDIGANIGYYTLLASTLVGSGGRVVSIEASPAIFEQLRTNVVLNKASNVRMVNIAVSDSTGQLPLYGGGRWNRGATSTAPRQPGQALEATVPAAPLDRLLSDDEMQRVALVKIDIEGGETPVLERFLETIDGYPHNLMILAELAPQVSRARLETVFNRLRAAEFRTFALENEYDIDWYLRWRRPAPLSEIEMLPPRQTDVIFVRGAPGQLSNGWHASSSRLSDSKRSS